MLCPGLVDTSDPNSSSNDTNLADSPDREFAEKAQHAFLSYCKEPLLQPEECLDVDDCNIGLVTEVETDHNPVASDEEVSVSHKHLGVSPTSRKKRRRVSEVALSDNEGQARNDMTWRKRPPRKKKKKEKALVKGTHSAEDGNEGDDEFEKANDNTISSDLMSNVIGQAHDSTVSSDPMSKEIGQASDNTISLNPMSKEICSLCVIGPESYSDAAHPLPCILPTPLPQSQCSCCHSTATVATMCSCPNCAPFPDVQAGEYVYVSSEGLHQVGYSTAVTMGVEASYPCHTAVADSYNIGHCGQLGCQCQQSNPNFHPNLLYSLTPITVQQCTCIDCTPLP